MEQRDLGGKAGEEERLFHGRVAAAHHGNLLAAEEEAVAGGATGDAVADQRLFARQAQPAGAGARGDDQRARRNFASRGLEPEGIYIQIHRVQMGQLEVSAEAGGLLLHVVDQFGALDALRPAGKVFHLGGHRELSAGLVALQNQRVKSGAGGVDGGGESGAAGAEDYGRANLCHEPSRVDFRRFWAGRWRAWPTFGRNTKHFRRRGNHSAERLFPSGSPAIRPSPLEWKGFRRRGGKCVEDEGLRFNSSRQLLFAPRQHGLELAHQVRLGSRRSGHRLGWGGGG
jgi:hypothetical protein